MGVVKAQSDMVNMQLKSTDDMPVLFLCPFDEFKQPFLGFSRIVRQIYRMMYKR